ncbi:hypothetical protein HA402_014130 [Bradysia odoriphaga]|nr:hypothetical protein HA402_014130 [Bradysia odoriphaga]
MLFICHQMAMDQEAGQKRKKVEKRQQVHLQRLVSQSTVPIIWVLGGPGSGKGTQCAKIVEKYGFSHFSTGDLLRDEVASGSDKGKELQDIMKRGELVSNAQVLSLLEVAMKKVTNSKGFLIDGYPRQKDQGAAFEQAIAPVDLILYFECRDETMVARILHRASQSAEVRADDNEETIKTRIATFSKNTNEILVLYPQQTRRIDAERGVDDIFGDVQNFIDATLAIKAVS